MRAKHWILICALLLLAGVPVLVCVSFNSSTQLIPPDPKAESMEPAVAIAVRNMRDRVLQQPKSGLAWGELAEVFLANGMEPESKVCLVEAEQLDCGNPRWPYLQAVTFTNHGEHEPSIPYYQRAIELSQSDDQVNLVAHLRVAEAQLHLGRVKESESHIRQARDRVSCDTRVHFDAGLLAVAIEDWTTARSNLTQCLNDPHTRKRARVQLTGVCGHLKDFARAAELQSELEQMAEDWDWLDPIFDQTMSRAVDKGSRFRMAVKLESQGRLDLAAQIAQSVVESYPDDDVAQAFLGRFLAQYGEFQGAERALRQAVKLAPHKIQPRYFLSLLLIQKGERFQQIGNTVQAESIFREAANQARLVLNMKPDYGFAHMALGLALKPQKKYFEAETELQKAVHCNPEYAEMHLRLAEVLVDLDRKADACSCYREALRLAAPKAPWRANAQARLAELEIDIAVRLIFAQLPQVR